MVGILIVAHAPLASALLACARHILGPDTIACRALDIPATEEPGRWLRAAQAEAAALETGSGLLVLTDLFGATPANIAAQLVVPRHVEALTGVNLAMLLRALSYRGQSSLEVLVDKAATGATAGVMKLASTAAQNQRPASAAGAPQGADQDAHARMQNQQ